MELPKKLKDEIWEYCRVNNITAVDEFITKMTQQGFTVEKHGATPFTSEKTIEVVKEVPVEVIKEVIKEVPVEVVKEVYITDDQNTKAMAEEIQTLNMELDKNSKKMLEQAEWAKKEIKRYMDELDKMVRENEALRGTIEHIKAENDAKITQLGKTLKLRKAQGLADNKDIYGEGKAGLYGSNTSDMQ